jgi:hypothetical protein
VGSLETGSRQYLSAPKDFDRESVSTVLSEFITMFCLQLEALLGLTWLLEAFLPTIKARNVYGCVDNYFGISRFNPGKILSLYAEQWYNIPFSATTPVHQLYKLSSLQASHGPLSSVLASVEEMYGRVHKRDFSLFPRSSALKKSPIMAKYFGKIARFRNVNALDNEENFFHVNSRGIVVEAKEEYGLHDGFGTPIIPSPEEEPSSDFSWFYGTDSNSKPEERHRAFVSFPQFVNLNGQMFSGWNRICRHSLLLIISAFLPR